MKKAKVLLVFLLVLSLIICSLSTFIGVFAAETDPRFIVSAVNGTPGGDVDVTVSIANNPGICAAGISINYDSNLTLLSATDGGLLKGYMPGGDISKNPYKLIWDDLSDVTANGILVTLKFNVNSSATFGSKLNVSVAYDPDEVYDVSDNQKTFECVAGGVTLECSHASKTSHPAKASTCKDAGWDAYSECNACHQLFDASNAEISAIPYRPLSTVHTYTNYVSNNDATCTADGTKTAVCYVCGAAPDTITDTGSKKPHTFIEKVDAQHLKSSATCTSKAVYYKSCQNCGAESTETFEYGTFADHNYVNKVDSQYLKSAATCTAKAVYYKSCSYCGLASSETFEAGEKLPHTFIEKVDAQHLKSSATCTSKAVYYKSCQECGVKSTTETFEYGTFADHNYVNKVASQYLKTPATCTNKAVYYKSCSNCGAKSTTETFESGETLPHSFTNYVSNNNATCTNNCTETAICDTCHVAQDTRDIPGTKLPHTYTNYVSNNDATCTADGTKTAYCAVCHAAPDTITDPGTKLAHNFAEQVSPEFIKTPATCTSKAVYYKSCTSCGLTNDETFEAGVFADHTYVYESDKDNHWKVCSVCKDKTAAEKHTFKYVKTKEPTTKEEGLEEEICEVCGYKSGNTKAIEKLVEKALAPASDSVIYDVPKIVEFALGKFDAGTIVKATEVETGTIFETAKKALDGVATKLVVFDFVATKDGVRVQPNGKVQVTIDIPEELSADNLAMFYVADDGSKKKLSIKVDKTNRKVTTELDHFSTYVLANVTKSPKGSDSDVAVLIIALLAVMGTSVLVGTKCRKGNK